MAPHAGRTIDGFWTLCSTSHSTPCSTRTAGVPSRHFGGPSRHLESRGSPIALRMTFRPSRVTPRGLPYELRPTTSATIIFRHLFIEIFITPLLIHNFPYHGKVTSINPKYGINAIGTTTFILYPAVDTHTVVLGDT